MPSIYKSQNGKYRAQIRVKGKSKSKYFATKSMAREWAYKQEEFLKDPTHEARGLTLIDVMESYNRDVSINKPSYKRECKRTEFFKRFDFCHLTIDKITKKHINDYRLDRLKEVKSSTVLRDFAYLGVVFEYAKGKEYISINPVHEADKPAPVPPRQQRMTQGEVEALCEALGFVEGEVKTTYQQVAVILLIALETAMRQGEITYLTWEQVKERSVYLPKTKNGEARTVPLSLRAKELIDMLPKDRKRLFTLSSDSVSTIFRRVRRRCGFHHLTFHDSRREATSRLAKKFDVMMLAKITGHKDLKMLLNVYYAPELSDFLDIMDS